MKVVCKTIACWIAIAGMCNISLADTFKEIKGDHFVVYSSAPKGEAREVLSAAERYYDSIASMLGYSRYDNFWTWENRCKIYLYKTQREYAQETGVHAWAGGHAQLKTRTIHSYLGKPDFLDTTLPHEIAHLIFRDHVGLDIDTVLWLHEGVAMSAETLRRDELFSFGKKVMKAGKHIPFDQLARVERIPTTISTEAVALFYAQSLLIVTYLIESYHSDRFVQFCRDIRDGHAVEEALARNYRRYGIETFADLEKSVVAYYS